MSTAAPDGPLKPFRVTSLTESEVREIAFNGFPKLAIDSDGTVVWCNGAVERLFEYVTGELVGKCLDILVPEQYREKHKAGRLAFFASPPRKARFYVKGLTKTGEVLEDLVVGIIPFVKYDQEFAVCVVLNVSDPMPLTKDQ